MLKGMRRSAKHVLWPLTIAMVISMGGYGVWYLVRPETSRTEIGAIWGEPVRLEEFIQATSNTQIIDVFSSLQCGSRNHLRSFVANLELIGGEYTPQFLTQEWYEEILDGPMEQCGN